MRSDNLGRLSERQRQCLRAAARGYSSKEIARQLGLSPSTVNNHIESAKKLVDAADRGEVARALVDFETGHKMPSDPQGLFIAANAATLSPLRTAANQEGTTWDLLRPPPVGGPENDLTGIQRSFHILQIALMSVIAIAAMSLVIAGLLHTFQP